METRIIPDDNLKDITMRGVKDETANCKELFCFAYDVMGKLPDIRCQHFRLINGKRTCSNLT